VCSTDTTLNGNDVAQTTKTAWKVMCDSNYTWPQPGGAEGNANIILYNPFTFKGPSVAEEVAWRQAHRALRQAVLASCNTAGTAGGSYAATCAGTATTTTSHPLYKACYGKNKCNFTSGGCIPQQVQFACVEPSYFVNKAPLYELMLFGSAVVGSPAYTANVTCPSPSSQVRVIRLRRCACLGA
jgi:hypothetical protein